MAIQILYVKYIGSDCLDVNRYGKKNSVGKVFRQRFIGVNYYGKTNIVLKYFISDCIDVWQEKCKIIWQKNIVQYVQYFGTDCLDSRSKLMYGNGV